MAIPVSELQKIAPSSIIELFELQLNTVLHGTNDIYRFHAGASLNSNDDIVWAGNDYIRMPLEAEGFEYSGNGQLPRPKIRVSNVLGTITAVLLTLPSGIEGAKVTRIRTLARYLDAVNFPGAVNPYGTPDSTAEFPREIYYIDRKSAENRDVIEFELAAAFDIAGVRAPKRQCLANICQWQYRGPECGYNANAYFDANGNPVGSIALDACGKKLSDCELRFGTLRYLGTVTLGSNVLVLDDPTSLDTGAPIEGFGIPAGTTVVSVSGTSVTMSANATATTSLTKTGRLQSSRLQINLSDTTGLAVGMTVSGPLIPAGTIIESISGNNVILGQPVLLEDVLALQTTKAGSLYVPNLAVPPTSSNGLIVNTSGLSIGMYVEGPTLLLEREATITNLVSPPLYPYTGVTLSYAPPINGSTGVYSFYTIPIQPIETYTFTATSRMYSFRPDAQLPFGSFPGVGTYFT